MSDVLTVAICVSLGVVVITCIFLIVALRGVVQFLSKTSDNIQHVVTVVDELKAETKPTLAALTVTLEQSGRTLTEVEAQIEVVRDTLQNFKEISERINTLEDRLQRKVTPTLEKAASFISGVGKFIEVFKSRVAK